MPDVPPKDDDPGVERVKKWSGIGSFIGATAFAGIVQVSGAEVSPQAMAAAFAASASLRSGLEAWAREKTIKTVQEPPLPFRQRLPDRDFGSQQLVALEPERGGQPQRESRDDRRRQPDRRGR